MGLLCGRLAFVHPEARMYIAKVHLSMVFPIVSQHRLLTLSASLAYFHTSPVAFVFEEGRAADYL